MNKGNVGIINEVGDLGLGFDVITEQEEEQLNRDAQKENNK